MRADVKYLISAELSLCTIREVTKGDSICNNPPIVVYSTGGFYINNIINSIFEYTKREKSNESIESNYQTKVFRCHIGRS